MKKTIFSILVALLIAPLFLNAQFFSENYSSLSTAGTNSLSGNLSVSSGQLNYNALESGQDYRFEKSIGTTLSSNDTWRAEFTFNINSHSPINYGAQLFILNSNTEHINTQTTGSSISVWMGDLLGGSTSTFLFIRGKDGSSFHSASSKIYFNKNTTYYARVERLSETAFVLAIYNQAARLPSQLVGSVCYTADNNNLGGFTTLQHGVTSSPTPRYCTGFIKELDIYTDPKENCGCDITANFEVFDEGACPVEFGYQTTIGPGNYFMGSVIRYDDNQFEFTNKLTGTFYHKYSSPYLNTHLDPTLTSFSYYHNTQTDQYECCSDTYSLTNGIIPTNGLCSHMNTSSTISLEACDAVFANMSLAIDRTSLKVDVTNTSTSTGSGYLGAVVDFGDGNVAHLVGQNDVVSNTYSTSSTYNICITTFAFAFTSEGVICCRDTQCVAVNMNEYDLFRKSSGISKSEDQIEFKVQPNPFNDQFKVSIESEASEVMIFNSIGKMLLRENTIGNSVLDIDLSDQPSGIYFIKVKIGEDFQGMKIVKE